MHTALDIVASSSCDPELWLSPSNFTYIGSRWTSMLNTLFRDHLFKSYCQHTYTWRNQSLKWSVKLFTSFVNFNVCRDSSRVGDNIRPRMPAEEWAFRCSNIGIRNAAVLPLPVLAIATTSLPSSNNGIVWKMSKISCTQPQPKKWVIIRLYHKLVQWHSPHKKLFKFINKQHIRKHSSNYLEYNSLYY